MNSYNIFLIETITPMHVGSGDITYGVVDNLIQRNPVTQIPVINGSSLKGSLREHSEKRIVPVGTTPAGTTSLLTTLDIDYLFGKETEIRSGSASNSNIRDSSPGRMMVFEANLLFLPLRSSQNVFYYATSPKILLDYIKCKKYFFPNNNKCDLLEQILKKFISPELETHDFVIFNEINGLEIEDYEKNKLFTISDPDTNTSFKELFKSEFSIDSSNVAIFNDTIFSSICERKLPVIARNNIGDDGISKNLFYEEILPRGTVLYFLLGEELINNNASPAYQNIVKFIKEEIIQIGANYSIGYGFSKVREVV